MMPSSHLDDLPSDQRQQYKELFEQERQLAEADQYSNRSSGSHGGGQDSATTMHSSWRSDGTGLGSIPIPLQPGEWIELERPTSAPPPPGFGGGQGERHRMANELLWGSSRGPPGGGSYYAEDSSGEGGGANGSHERLSSFTNFLGTSLIESIEDATGERAGGAAPTAHDDLNWHRLTRYTGFRMVGTHPPVPSMEGHGPPTSFNGGVGSVAQQRGPPVALFPPSSGSGAGASSNMISSSASYDGGVSIPRFDPRNFSKMSGPSLTPDRPTAVAHAGGFPTSLSSPHGKRVEDGARGPIGSHPHHPNNNSSNGSSGFVSSLTVQRGGNMQLPAPKDIGMNVSEPEGENQLGAVSSEVVSHRLDDKDANNSTSINSDRGSVGSGANHLSIHANEFKPASALSTPTVLGPAALSSNSAAAPANLETASGNSSISDSAGAKSDISPRQAEMELKPFLWDLDRNRPSRTLAILHVSFLRLTDVRSACETFGVLESFRSEFSTKGIYFAAYYDIRSAEYAAVELQPILQRLSVMQRSSDEVIVRYCLPLNSSSQFDESQILISDLPSDVNEYALRSMLSMYGAVRSVLAQGHGSFVVEFQSVQDSKQALLELESTQPWGADVQVEVGLRSPSDRSGGRELLAMMSRWRTGMTRQSQQPVSVSDAFRRQVQVMPGSAPSWRGAESASSPSPAVAGSLEGVASSGSNFAIYGGTTVPHRGDTLTTQLILGPDGRYTQVMVPAPVNYAHFSPGAVIDPRQQQIFQGPNGQIYIASTPALPANTHVFAQEHQHASSHTAFPLTILTNSSYIDSTGRVGHGATPYYAHVVTNDASSQISSRSHRSAQSTNEDKDNRHLMLDLEAVEGGRDTRTSLMVRNIPNKYTQQMLLSEFEENGHGPGIIDFFYLPIDFKNRCNRGYAFINFVNCKDILPFHQRYYGKHWRTFNSDKICDITYARIQGKAAMLKRFENSALMEKDDEYKPLVFVSDGPDKGKRLPFPDSANRSAATTASTSTSTS